MRRRIGPVRAGARPRPAGEPGLDDQDGRRLSARGRVWSGLLTLVGAVSLVCGLTWVLLNLHGPEPFVDLATGVVLALGGLVLLMPHRIRLPGMATGIAAVVAGVGGTAAGIAVKHGHRLLHVRVRRGSRVSVLLASARRRRRRPRRWPGGWPPPTRGMSTSPGWLSTSSSGRNSASCSWLWWSWCGGRAAADSPFRRARPVTRPDTRAMTAGRRLRDRSARADG